MESKAFLILSRSQRDRVEGRTASGLTTAHREQLVDKADTCRHARLDQRLRASDRLLAIDSPGRGRVWGFVAHVYPTSNRIPCASGSSRE